MSFLGWFLGGKAMCRDTDGAHRTLWASTTVCVHSPITDTARCAENQLLASFSLGICVSNKRACSILCPASFVILLLTICVCFRIAHWLLWGLSDSSYGAMDELQDVQLTEIKPLLNDKVMLLLHCSRSWAPADFVCAGEPWLSACSLKCLKH